MADEKREPPKSAEELLERYAAGERDFGGSKLDEADLSGADLSQANLYGANLFHANLSQANLSGANFEDAVLSLANLSGANLNEADLSGAVLSRANLFKTELFNAHFILADLSGANFRNAYLCGAVLSDAFLEGADLREADLENAAIINASLKHTKLDSVDLGGVAFDHNTDLLTAKWQTLIFASKTYHRDAVERGDEILPAGMGNPLRFVFNTNRVLTGEEYEAARDLIAAFGSISKSTELILELAASGERFTIASRGDYTESANIGLAVLRAVQAQGETSSPHPKPVERLSEGIEGLAKQMDQTLEMELRTQQKLDNMQSLFEALVPTLIEFPNERVAKDFKEAAAKADLPLDDVKIEGSIVRFARRLREMPETPSILVGLLAEFAGIPGGFSRGFVSTRATHATLTGKKNTDWQ